MIYQNRKTYDIEFHQLFKHNYKMYNPQMMQMQQMNMAGGMGMAMNPAMGMTPGMGMMMPGAGMGMMNTNSFIFMGNSLSLQSRLDALNDA